MTNSLSKAYVVTFERNVRFLAQQKGSKLRQHCQTKGESSKSHNWERVGLLSASLKSGRAVGSPVNDTPFSRRATSQATYHAGDLIEPEDLVQVLIDPTSAITTALAHAMGRQIDDIIIAAATTDNTSDGAGSTVAFPTTGGAFGTGQVVSDGSASITLDLVASVTQQFMYNNIDADVSKVMVIGPLQVRQIAQIEKATSEFYVNAKALAMDGFVRNWMGYSWVYSNRLLTDDAGASLNCLAFSEMAMGLHVTKDIWARVEEDPSRSFAWQVYSALTAGAVRVEDEHIVKFKLKNT